MAIPDYQTLMLPVLEFAARGETSVRDCIAALADRLGLSQEECSQLLPSRKQAVFANRVHWAKTYLVQAGLLESTRRAHFQLTPRGSEVLARRPDRVDNKLLMHFPEFREFWERSRSRRGNGGLEPISEVLSTDDLAPSATPEERIEAAYTEITNELRAAILDRITKGTPQFFEKIVVDLLTKMGYGGSRANAGRRVGKTADGGIDGVINEDPLGLDSVYLQAKRYAPGNTVGVDKVREFAGSLVERGATKGVFVTTSQFAPAAKAYAGRIPQRLILIDGDELTRLMVGWGSGLTTRSSCASSTSTISRRTPVLNRASDQPRPGITPPVAGSMPPWARILIGRANRLTPVPGFTDDDMMTVWERCEGRCAMSGLEFSEVVVGTGRARKPYAPSLDRIDRSRGYEPDNVRLVTAVANFAMNAWGLEPVRDLARLWPKSTQKRREIQPIRLGALGRTLRSPRPNGKQRFLQAKPKSRYGVASPLSSVPGRSGRPGCGQRRRRRSEPRQPVNLPLKA